MVRTYIPPTLARWVRRYGIRWRYAYRLHRCRAGFRQYGDQYPHPLLFVAGLPKSGTSWLESMLASYPGFQSVGIPEAVRYELKHGGSHDYDLPADAVTRFKKSLAVLKLHVHGSSRNARLLHDEDVPYVVLYRDLRDVAVSHYFYVRRTPWHPEYEEYAARSVEEGLLYFGRTLLSDFVDWMRSWRERRSTEMSLELRYEDLLANTEERFRQVASHFGLDSSSSTIRCIVAEHSFKNMSDGRSRGQQDQKSFVRKGVSGDWKNHFTPAVKTLFKKKAGEALTEFGYETDLDW
nr:sulfotransferase domain-containing protein [Salinibacter ruber]